jgi:hypothetical protein
LKRIFVDPPYSAYENNKLFDVSDKFLNRDDSLAPFVKLKDDYAKKNIELLTYDQLAKFTKEEVRGDGYMSFGIIRPQNEWENSGLKLDAFFLMEPPLVKPDMYEALPQLTKLFEKVFVHNLTGDCFSLADVDKSKLQKLFWPQPYGQVVKPLWENEERKKSVIIINGNHRPMRFLDKELYSKRIEWGVALNQYIPVELYGRGWDKFLSRSLFWITYLKNYFQIKKIYHGPCESKLKLMSTFDFALCFENLIMNGYITEKIFDCFYSGVIPIYRGGSDITQYIPKESFIDLRDFKNAEELGAFLNALSLEKKRQMRNAAKNFLEHEGQKYYEFSQTIMPDNS